MKILKYFSKLKIQSKLYFVSCFLTVSVIISIYIFTYKFFIPLVAKEHIKHNNISFEQASNFYTSTFEQIDKNIIEVSQNKNIINIFSENLDLNDYKEVINRKKLIDLEINTIFQDRNFIESIIIIGKNNILYRYDWSNQGYILQEHFFYEDLFKNNTFSDVSNEGKLFFYDSSEEPSVKHFNNLAHGKVLYYKNIRDFKKNESIANIIFTFKPDIFSNIFFKYITEQDLSFYTPNNNLISSYQHKNKSISESIDMPIIYNQYDNNAIINNGILTMYHKLPGNDVLLISQFELYNNILNVSKLNIYAIFYLGIYLLITGVLALVFSKRILMPIHNLKHELSNDQTYENIDYTLEKYTPSFFYRLRLKTKINTYFVITIIVPNMLILVLLFFSYYKIYNQTIVTLNSGTMKHIKVNIDQNLQKIDNISKQLITDNYVQRNMNNIKKNKNYVLSELDSLFYKTVIAEQDLMYMELIDTYGNVIYPINQYNSLFNFSSNYLLDEVNGNKLSFIHAGNDKLIEPYILLSRRIKSLYEYNFNEDLGGSTLFLKQQALLSAFDNTKPSNSSFYFIIYDNDNIFPSNNNSFIDSYVRENSFFYDQINDSNGFFTINTDKKYIVFYETTKYFNLKIISILPYQEIISSLNGLVIYTIIYIIVLLFIISIASILISQIVIKPFEQLKGQIEQSINNREPHISIDYYGNDEIVLISRQFNSLAKKVRVLMEEIYRSKIQEKELLYLEKEAQLYALQQQINPHFIYNTLEAIKWMAFEKGALEICDMSTSLGSFLRTAVESTDLISFKEEIEHLKNYLKIQKIRYSERLKVTFLIDDEIMNYKTIKLILQPIVENSITHGIDKIVNEGEIIIKGYKSENRICFEITDNGLGMKEEELERLRSSLITSKISSKKKSIGVNNVYQRLKLYFNNDFNFEIDSEYHVGTTIRFSIPCITTD